MLGNCEPDLMNRGGWAGYRHGQSGSASPVKVGRCAGAVETTWPDVPSSLSVNPRYRPDHG
jgi:hypothetical protein